MAERRGDEQQDEPVVDLDEIVKDERSMAGDEGGLGGDAVARDTDESMMMDREQRDPLFESTIANPDLVSESVWAPEGIESVGEYSRDASAPADTFIEDQDDDEAAHEGRS
jgi:hypothetical protein